MLKRHLRRCSRGPYGTCGGRRGKEAFFFNHDSGQSAPYSTFDTWLVSGFRVYFEGLGFKV